MRCRAVLVLVALLGGGVSSGCTQITAACRRDAGEAPTVIANDELLLFLDKAGTPLRRALLLRDVARATTFVLLGSSVALDALGLAYFFSYANAPGADLTVALAIVVSASISVVGLTVLHQFVEPALRKRVMTILDKAIRLEPRCSSPYGVWN